MNPSKQLSTSTDDSPPSPSTVDADDISLLPLYTATGFTPRLASRSTGSESPKRLIQLSSELEKVKLDLRQSHQALAKDPHLKGKGKRLQSRKTLFMSTSSDDTTDTVDPTAIIKEAERADLQLKEIELRPTLPEQTSTDKVAPERRHFEYVYRNIHDPKLYQYIKDLTKWHNFVLEHKLAPDYAQPILDLDGEEISKQVEFNLTNLLYINSDLLDRLNRGGRRTKTHGVQKTKHTTTKSSQESLDSQKHSPPSDNNSSGSSDSFVLLSGNNDKDKSTKDLRRDSDSHDSNTNKNLKLATPVHTPAQSPVNTPTHTPSHTPPTSSPSLSPSPPPHQPNIIPQHEPSGRNTPTSSRTSTPDLDNSYIDSDSDSDFEMGERKEKVPAFFPIEKFDGRDLTQTKRHWQMFKDFCDQHRYSFTETAPATEGDEPVPPNKDEIFKYFKLTLTDLARSWYENNKFKDPEELCRKFLNDFSPYGKSSHQWLQQWNSLRFNPDTDNFDDFLIKFEELATLVGAPASYKLQAFKTMMPTTVLLNIRAEEDYETCIQAARDMIIIIQNPLSNKMSTLSLIQSRSPSPNMRNRSPSPGPPQTVKPQQRPSRQKEKARWPPNQEPIPRPILKKSNLIPPRQPQNAGRGRNNYFFRPRSLSRTRNGQVPRCFNCGILGHVQRNCFTRTKIPREQNFPQRFTPNQPSKNRRNGPPRQVHFNDMPQYRNSRPQYRNSKPQYNPQYTQKYQQRRNDNYQNYRQDYQPQYQQYDTQVQYNDQEETQTQYAYQDNTYQDGVYHTNEYPNVNGMQLTDTFHNLNQ